MREIERVELVDDDGVVAGAAVDIDLPRDRA